MQADYMGARSTLEEAREQFDLLGDPLWLGYCHRSLGELFHEQGDHAEAKSNLQEASKLFRAIGKINDANWCDECIEELNQILVEESTS